MQETFRQHGFLPSREPLTAFPRDSALAVLDELGRDLPSLLEDDGFRQYAQALDIPPWPRDWMGEDFLPELRLYYVRLGFLASGYVNQLGQEPARVLPKNIAIPLCRACELLNRPPILSYDGYALYNWRRFRADGPIALGNIDTVQNFVHLYDEHWFILVHVEIEALASQMLDAIADAHVAVTADDAGKLKQALEQIEDSLRSQARVLRRIPEKMDPALYFKTFRRYIRFFEDVTYEGVDQAAVQYRGETGAQSSILPTLLAFLKIPHQPSPLINHLKDMRNYMPVEHRALIAEVEAMPPVKEVADREAFNAVLDALATFREVHYGWAQQYINQWEPDPRGTGGTPYMQWLHQLIDETRAFMLD